MNGPLTADGFAEGAQIERYEAYQPIDLGNHTYNITLAIAGLTRADTTKTYLLKVANEFGQQNYSIEIRAVSPVNFGVRNGNKTASD